MHNTTDTSVLPANRNYKDRLFTMIFSDKKALLSLYNAVNGSNYTDPDLLTVNTLDNAVYMTMKNDLSFLFDFARVYLYEHQSSWNPNLPLRQFFYTADLFSGIAKNRNLYGTKIVKIPAPEFFVFYNGTDSKPERQILKLSDAFEVRQEDPQLELKTTVLNINRGCNSELMAACKDLRDYAEYTARVREYAKRKTIDEAVEQAITECINEGILSEFLSQNRTEAKKVSIYEYDEEKHMRMEREASFKEGFSEGANIAIQVLRLHAKGKSEEEIALELGISREIIRSLLSIE